jgi:formamidopyrimidine-DNA glycosylase
MPELPEVEHAKRRLLSFAAGARITKATVHDKTVLRGQRERAFTRALEARTIEGAERRGKSLLVRLSDGGGLAMHLGMTGSVVLRRADEAPSRFSRITLHVAHEGAPEGAIHFDDPRKLGRLFAGELAEARTIAKHDELGPDAASLADARALADRLSDARAPIKSALMDQSRIAGLGNIHVGEALFLARLHPMRPARSLDARSFQHLFAGVKETLDRALAELDRLDESGEPLVYVSAGGENPFLVYDRAGEPCPRCKRAITREVHAGRSTYVCTRCQRAPKAGALA